MRYYTVGETKHLEIIALLMGTALGLFLGVFVTYLILDAVRAYRSRQFQRIENDTRDAKARVIGIAHGAQAEMIRLLMEGRSRRGGG